MVPIHWNEPRIIVDDLAVKLAGVFIPDTINILRKQSLLELMRIEIDFPILEVGVYIASKQESALFLFNIDGVDVVQHLDPLDQSMQFSINFIKVGIGLNKCFWLKSCYGLCAR